MRRYLNPRLKLQYIQVDDPDDLWRQLHTRSQDQQILLLLQVRSDWINLRVLDFLDFIFSNFDFYCVLAQFQFCA